jgi:protoheme IX farnesyltransferase
MMGWAAAAGRLEPGAWILGGILLVWQIPHFLAIAWRRRADYRRAGFRTLPLGDPSGSVTGLVTVLYAAALLPVSLAAVLAGLAGWHYALTSITLGCGMLLLSIAFYRMRTGDSARRLFLASIVYLPLLLAMMLADNAPVVVSRAGEPGIEVHATLTSNTVANRG